MHHLSKEDADHVSRSFSKFKVIVSLEEIESQCDVEILKDVFENMLDLALRYTESICAFQRIMKQSRESLDPVGDRQAIESVRGSIHDAFNTSVDIVSRTMVRNNKKIDWRNRIGDDRAALGLFALTLSFEYVKREIERGAL